mmetsp:Transcript_6704/g.21159  ORF Transcript_6704/g.21159 Transcript_6704/m.21159 type:complete len:239 (+) Transcript_6704:745-1461(+)
MPTCLSKTRPSTERLAPLKKKSLRRVAAPRRAAGSVYRAPARSAIVTIATSDASMSCAYDFGGGVGAPASASAGKKPRPAITAMRAVEPGAPPVSVGSSRDGMSSDQSILKCGSTILSLRGRLSQIWKSSRRLGPARSSSGNISECEIPRPAVIHCASPPSPNRPDAPVLSQWSTMPWRTSVTVSKPRCGCLGKPGTLRPWYMFQPLAEPKSEPSGRPRSSSLGGPIESSPAGYLSSW